MATKGIPYEHVCIECGKHFLGYGCRRCNNCQRVHATKIVARSRAKHREQAIKGKENPGNGWQYCIKCKKKRQLSEFRTRCSDGRGRRNKICDRCLTSIYAAREYDHINLKYWRTKAYSCNTAARQRVASVKGVKLPQVSLSDLEWVCKPQDLIKLFNQQDGKCHYCGVQLEPRNITIDHKTPLSRDGGHTLGNVCFTCRDCNMLKSTRTETEFNEFVQEYIRRFARTGRGQDKEPVDNT